MAALAKATVAELEAASGTLASLPPYRCLRGPETGLVMARGRIGGTAGPFNLGEVAVTRCVVALEDGGPEGFAYVLGRDPRRAELAALFDAVLQRGASPEAAAAVGRLEAAATERRRRAAGEAEATRVDFFTMVRE